MNTHTFKLGDIPGHERLRCRYSNQLKLPAKGLAYAIDSNTCQKDVRDAAEYLYNIHIT
ncbi:signal recognition particle receptor subunit beta-like isoform X2 [Lasioglossum baleicum]